MKRLSYSSLMAMAILLLSVSWHEIRVQAEDGPSESECRPYIEKALHELKSPVPDNFDGSGDDVSVEEQDVSKEIVPDYNTENVQSDQDASVEATSAEASQVEIHDDDLKHDSIDDASDENQEQKTDNDEVSQEDADSKLEKTSAEDETSSETLDNDSKQDNTPDVEESENVSEEKHKNEESDEDADSTTDEIQNDENDQRHDNDDTEDSPSSEQKDTASNEEGPENSQEASENDHEEDEKSEADQISEEENDLKKDTDKSEENEEDSNTEKTTESAENLEESNQTPMSTESEEKTDNSREETISKEEHEETETSPKVENITESHEKESAEESSAQNELSSEDLVEKEDENDSTEEAIPEDDLLPEVGFPHELRSRDHVNDILYMDNKEKETAINHVAETILRDLKRVYENSIKPLEALYKYRDLSNRHFGDSEIFSKPLIVFMGPWSGGKSTIINYLTENENTEYSLRSGAEPSPAYFNIVMYGDEVEVLDGAQLAADWTFSGLQKFGQGLEERLHGLKLPNSLLKKVNIVEIPGILEVRKQVSRLFPFNDACQWFIDRADVIFLVYDPAKLDVGPETEAILDQLKGREYQTRIVLNKADKVKPEELLRVQSALVWNISPLMSSAQPPAMYTVSLWSQLYESGAPTRLLQAQEKALLKDLRNAIDKRIENKIASARRFAVRVRNHAKMVDCYLTTYYNHKSLFGNKKRIADQIIENPQNYHIYEGLSTLTNISRYDLPDPDIYKDFFHLNPLFEFKKLSETCTYFRGCPINKLDVAIAYDLPELIGKYKKMAEGALSKIDAPY